MAGSDEDYRSHFSRGPGGMKPIGILSVDVGTKIDGPRHRYESMSRTPIRDRWLLSPNSSFRRRPESRRGGERQDRHTIGKNPAPHHFHPLIWPAQVHGDSRACGNPGETRPAHHRTCSNETDTTSRQISFSHLGEGRGEGKKTLDIPAKACPASRYLAGTPGKHGSRK